MPLSDSIQKRLKEQGYNNLQIKTFNSAFDRGGEQAFTERYKATAVQKAGVNQPAPAPAPDALTSGGKANKQLTPIGQAIDANKMSQRVVTEPTNSPAPAQTPTPNTTPTPTPTPTTQEVAQPQATAPAPTQEAPQAPVVTTPQPITPQVTTPQVTTPTPQPTQAPAPVESAQPTTEVTPQRATQIKNNLEEGLKNAPQLFSTYEQYKEAYGYEGKPQAEKALLDQFWNGKVAPQKTQEAVTNAQKKPVSTSLKSITGLPENKMNALSQDLERETQRFNKLNSNQLYGALVAGDISPDTPQWSDLLALNNGVESQAMIEAKAKFDGYKRALRLNQSGSSLSSNIKGETATFNDPLKKVSDTIIAKIGDIKSKNTEDINYEEAYRESLANNPEIRTLTEEVNGLNTQIKQAERAKRSLSDEISAQYPGMPKGTQIALIARLSEDIDDGLIALYDQRDSKQANLQYLSQVEQKALDYKIAQYQEDKVALATLENQLLEIQQKSAGLEYDTAQKYEDRAYQSQLLQNEREFNIARDDAQRKYEQELLQDTRSYNEKQLAKEREYEMLRLKDERAYEQAIAAGKPDIFESNGSTYVYRNGRAELLVGAPTQSTGTVTPTGNIIKTTFAGKNISLDAVAVPALNSAFSALQSAGLDKGIVLREGVAGHRDQVQAIKEMANRLGFAFNANNPADTAKKLRAAGHQIADPGSSSHETGLAFDVYSDNKYSPLRPEQVAILNANGWYQTAGDNDKGHFEYVGNGQGVESGINTASLPLYRKYIEEGQLPSAPILKGFNITADAFIENAQNGYDQYLVQKANEISSKNPNLSVQFTPSYSSTSATQKESLNQSIVKIGELDSRLQQLKDLFNKSGTEVLPTQTKALMESLRQQIILKAKEVENLGVLNGPDLGILESILPATTGIANGLFSLDRNTMAKLDRIQNNYRADAASKAINYGANISFKDAQLASTSKDAQPANTGGGQIFTGVGGSYPVK